MDTLEFLQAFISENKLPSKHLLYANNSSTYATGQCIVFNFLMKHTKAYNYIIIFLLCITGGKFFTKGAHIVKKHTPKT